MEKPDTLRCLRCDAPAGKTKNAKVPAEAFCCAGCAVAARVPVDAQGNFPVNASLVRALVVGFLYFNELLFAVVAVLVREGERAAWSPRFGWMAAGAGLAVWAAVAWVHRAERVARVVDLFVIAVAAALHALAFWKLPPSAACMAGANGALLAWSIRGLARKRAAAGAGV